LPGKGKLRRLKLEEAGHRCEACGVPKPVRYLSAHHVDEDAYDRRGQERLSDPRVVCCKCHLWGHGRF
jgi:hypothetical protein